VGTVSIAGKTFDIYGEHIIDDAGPPVVLSASSYFAGTLNATAWDSASIDDQARALVTAGRIFDKQLWVGSMTDPTTPQPLAWPRTGVPTCDGIVADPNQIPERVIFGSYEYALAILQDATTQTQTNTGSNVRRVLERKKVGDLETEDETEYFSATNSGANAATRFPATVQEYISCYVGGQLGGATVVGAAESVFIDWDFGIS
jgi:hypothetical protein